MYNVFVVEDEIVTREGIRNNIPWDDTPFTLVGEAPDGEMALHALRDIKPDILITDIKMPFMDGLALSRILKEEQHWIKIIILSGHDEFHYAREAISIGVEEYLLKPVSSVDMLASLYKVAERLEKEKRQLTDLESLKKKVRSHQEILREKWGFDLIMGRMDLIHALDNAKNLGLELSAPGYAVMIVRNICPPELGDLHERTGRIISDMAESRRDILLSLPNKRDYILIVKCDNPSMGEDRLYALAQGIKHETERNSGCSLSIGISSVAAHLEEVRSAYGEVLKIMPYMAESEESSIMGAGDMPSPPMVKRHSEQIRRAKNYIEKNFMSPDISLSAVASHVNVSPNHFSTVFSQEAGKTFIEYLTGIRIERAKHLLLSSTMKCSDIAYDVGYGDPHYFSFIFKKNMGVSPREFRSSRSSL